MSHWCKEAPRCIACDPCTTQKFMPREVARGICICAADNLWFACSKAMSLPRLGRILSKMVPWMHLFARLVICLRLFGSSAGRKKYIGETKNKNVAVRQFHIRLLMIYADALACFVRTINDETTIMLDFMCEFNLWQFLNYLFLRPVPRAGSAWRWNELWHEKNLVCTSRTYVCNSSKWPITPAVTYFDYRKSRCGIHVVVYASRLWASS